MKRTLKFRKDLDDELPQWVTETDPRIPRCIKCGTEVPSAKDLHTLCRQCRGGDETLRNHDIRALIRGVIAKLDEDVVDQLTKTYGRPASDNRVRHHAERFVARGLDRASAYRQAESMVADASHRQHCEVCRATEAATPMRESGLRSSD